MNQQKSIIIIVIFVLAIIISFALPKPKYKSLNILSQIRIPETAVEWKSKDISKEFNTKDERYNFLSEIFARIYTDKNDNSLLFLVLDAGNFHNPKVCFSASGYKVKELNDTEIKVAGRSFKALSLYTQKGNEGIVLLYWLCIDKKVTSWTGQKIKELWASLFQTKKAGLMVRLEIPAQEKSIEGALTFGQKFLNDLSSNLSPDQISYLFGK
ncbi:MAG: exosortase C-terminal domain/associated protein EpsI [Candidatus Omnitrophota bacterium]|jgi:EpsI family protein